MVSFVNSRPLAEEENHTRMNRRSLLRHASAAGLATVAAGSLAGAVAAQEASPQASPAASPVAVLYDGPTGTLSPDREDFLATIHEHFALEAPAKTGGTLIQTQTTDITTVNFITPSDVYSQWITGLCNDGLLSYSPVDGTWGPGIADSWELAADGVTYTFHLNPNVVWHDGTPFTADDVIFSFDATVAKDSPSPWQGDVMSVLHSYAKIDDLTVEIVAKEPVATFINKTVGTVAMVPKHIWERVPFAEWGSDPGSTGSDPSRVIGTGPFKFVEWIQNDHVTIEKNPDYWDKEHVQVAIDQYIYRVVADANSAFQSLLTGESDLFGLSPTQAESVKKSNPEITLTIYDTFGFGFYAANQDQSKTTLFTDIPTRQALLYGLDRDLIADTIYLNYAIRADGTQPIPSPAYKPDQMRTLYDYDPDKARQLLSDAGWADSDGDGILERDGTKLSFECQFPEATAVYEQLLPYMQEAWKDIGVEMVPTAIPFPTLVDNFNVGNFVMSLLGFSVGSDPDQSWIFGTDATPPAGFNIMHYSNPDYDAIIPQQNAALDPDKRVELIVEQTNIVNDDAALGVMTFSKSIAGSAPRVHNYFPNAFGSVWSVPYIWLED